MNEKMENLAAGRRIYSLDMAKFICSVLVVMIHITPFDGIGFLGFGIRSYAARLSVPFFFVTSGFLLFRKTSYENLDTEYIFKYVCRLIRLYLVWSVIYLYPRVDNIIKSGDSLFQGILVYIKHFLFAGSYRHLWYINALIVATILTAVLIWKRCAVRTIFLAGGILYFAGLFAQSWFGLITPLRELLPDFWSVLRLLQRLFHTTRNGLFEGFLFVALGMAFAFKDIRISRIRSFLGFGVSMLALLAEAVLVKFYGFAKEEDMYLFLVPAVFFLFHIVLHTELRERKIYRILGMLGSLVYFVHMWFFEIAYRILDLLKWNTFNRTLLFLLVELSSIAVSYMILRLSETKRFRWLRYLYA